MTTLHECTDCGNCTFYEKRRCLECGNSSWIEREPGTGELLAITTVHVSPDGVPTPNLLGLAQFEDEVNLVGQLESDLAVGDPVKLDTGRTLRDNGNKTRTGPRLVSAEE
ncbi:OB-fold domain-containing protein [Natrinema sp. 1APR25-10V2]|uniref:Zn-ribbon domain-containing OB-fold protein n=1 Tax=Natrinema sp. 1APR25-10V2 TaxID=2951081 RepID=UPI002874F631|nr:OB-fold domain-containing protein [Natrinema sp. 1APR25-10V2]MDS0476907.1 OB-fold domain-containing protein [Natrinema sp. 1APR25-10V2]